MSATADAQTMLRGTVVGRSGGPLAGVRVYGILRGVIRSEATTDSAGRFRLRWWADSLPAMLAFRRIGIAPATRTLDRWPTTSEIDRVELEDRAAELARIFVRAKASRPIQDVGLGTLGPGTVARPLDVTSGLSGDFTGDPAAALRWVPGVTLPPGGGLRDLSVFGLGGGDNASTLNGQATHGAPLPRDGLTQSLRLSTYDPRQGRFAGAVLTSMLPSGTFIQRASGRVTIAPSLAQAAGGEASLLGPAPTDVIASGTLAGPLSADRTFFSASGQVQRQTTTVPAFGAFGTIASDADGLDSLRLVEQIAASRGLLGPTPLGARSLQSTTRASSIARIDFTPNAQAAGNAQATVFYLLLTGATAAQRNLGVGRTSAPATATDADRTDGSLQAVWAPYLRAALLEMRSRISGGVQHTRPITALPNATIAPLVLADGISASASVGGSGQPALRDRYRTWETSVDLSWRNASGSHAWNAFAQHEWQHRGLGTDALGGGTLLYPSLAAFRDETPARFIGAPANTAITGRSQHVVLAFSDTWSPSAAARDPFAVRAGGLTVQFGLRAEADVLGVPEERTDGPRVGEVSTRRLVRTALLPMVGATWRTSVVNGRSEGFPTSFFRHEFQAGVRRYRGGTGVVGQSALPFGAGLGRLRLQEECIGDAIVAPGAGALGAGIAGCDPTAGVPLVLRSASRTTLAGAWHPSESVRGEFRWTRRQSPALSTDVTATLAFNSRQPGVLDRNIRTTVVDRDTSEGGRPRFMDAASIDPRTGAVASAAARLDDRVGRLVDLRADGRSRVAQLTLAATWRPGATASPRLDPIRPINGQLRVAYTGTWGMVSGNAYTLGTSGAPTDRVTGRVAAPAHAVLLTGRLDVDRWFTLQTGLRVQSGLPFTPIYGSDVNGDGAANDRIHVPDGARRAALLSTVSGPASRCLAQVSGTFAPVNGCTGRWSVTMAPVLVELDPRRFRLGSRTTATLAILNPLSAVDRLVNGRNRRGWGVTDLTDPSLLTVAGYDPASRTFRYIANPGPTASRDARALLQPPFGVTLDIRFDLSRNLETQRIETFVRRGDAGQPLPPSQFHASLLRDAAAFGAEDILLITRSLDSLDVDSTQRATLEALAQRRLAERSALLARLAERLANGLHDLRSRELRDAWHGTMIASLESSERITQEALAVLTPAQIGWLLRRDLLPSFQRPRGWLERERRLPQLTVR